MDEPDEIFIPKGLNVDIHHVLSTHSLPLAAARNMGIKASKTENIIFIDVDCMVSPTLFDSLLSRLQSDKIIAAYPLYLPIVPENEIISNLSIGQYLILRGNTYLPESRFHIYSFGF